MVLKSHNTNNPIVFLDIRIGPEKVGRLIVELRKDVVPKTVENFRCLITGERGVSNNGTKLHYKNCRFHKVGRLFMSQGGDIVNNNGTSGESIYGKFFEDENFELEHTEGALSMANFGRKNTNNSQFFITSIECPHLDGINVVFGYVIRGFGIVQEMEKYTSNVGVPSEEIVIEDCGELNSIDDLNVADNDETNDNLPPFTGDWIDNDKEFTIEEMLDILNKIKSAGNYFYHLKKFVESCRKYKKTARYYNFFKGKIATNSDIKILEEFNVLNCINMAAVYLKMKKYDEVLTSCDEALRHNSNNSKALFRRGQAHIELKNYEYSLEDLKRAHKLAPDSKIILTEFDRAKKLLMDYREKEKRVYINLFK